MVLYINTYIVPSGIMQKVWQDLPSRYKFYLVSFLAGTTLWLASLVVPGVDIVYGLVFLALSIGLIFTTKKAESFPDHSTRDHFEQADRLNWYNVVPAICVVLASILFVWGPIHRATIVLLMWGISCAGIWFVSTAARATLGNQLIANYLVKKFPTLPTEKLVKGVSMIITKKHIPVRDLSLELQIDASEAAALRHLVKKYLENNLA
ncbi:hypothetical protein KC640_03260 [Candidatus Dojkabacteria bacterium]|uniref:Uncharacterized protein n=1 Tax=Candidatus Dojkabacteria bacterium TaxID=2099670 RepID=A0A955IDC4_9BACT|nr:hypothetical protein [Candidatus Dojkabacteria bacterium]